MGMTSSLDCDLANVCQTCNALETPWECCYWDEKRGSRCRFHSADFHVGHDRLASKDWQAQLEKVIGEAREVVSHIRLGTAESFPSRFIPEVKLGKQDRSNSLAVVRKVEVPIIAVSLSEFYNGTRKLPGLQLARRVGLRRYLGFDHQVLLTTDVPDILCEHFLRRPQELKDNVKLLEPDFVTTPDTSCYHNLPAAISLYNISRALVATGALADTNAKVVGLALGSNSVQLLDHARSLKRLGCNLIAVPLYEFRRAGQSDIARHRARIVKSMVGVKVLALSCSPWSGKRLVLADYYSSWSWFPSSKGQSFDFEYAVGKLRRFLRTCMNESHQEVLP